MPISTFQEFSIKDQITTYVCGLPFPLQDCCIGKVVKGIRQLMQHAKVGYHLMRKELVFNNPKQLQIFRDLLMLQISPITIIFLKIPLSHTITFHNKISHLRNHFFLLSFPLQFSVIYVAEIT